MFEEIRAAAQRLEGVAHRTPIATSRTLDEATGAEVLLKCENLQRVGAFKFRGAYNAISRLSPEERRRGVLAYSSGNHAQGVALAGKLLGVPTTIVMPTDAPAIKLAATRGYGAHVVEYDRETETRREVAARLMEEGDFVLIPPFDHPHIVAGQGTAALELFDEVGDLDLLLVPTGGGGLLSGCAVAARQVSPSCRVVGIEPAVADDATRSFYTGTIQRVVNPPTIADGTRTESLGELTFELIREHVDAMRTVSEEAIVEAVRFLFFRVKQVVEPSGALGVAALLSEAVDAEGRVGVVLSGGNVDGPTMARILGATF
jgi:threonine dehydratase